MANLQSKTEFKENNTVKRKKILGAVKKNIVSWILFFPAVFVLYFMIWRPQVVGFWYSLCKMRQYTAEGFIGFDNYVRVLTHSQFLSLLWNTVQYVLWSLVIGFLPPFFVALMINELVHFKNGFKIIAYLPSVVPAIAALMMWKLMYAAGSTGLLNQLRSALGLGAVDWLSDSRFVILYIIISMTWKSFGGAMLLYFAAIQSIAPELYEAATVDGAGVVRRFWNITVPQVGGIMLLCFVRQIIAVFQVMQEPLAMTGSTFRPAMSIGLQIYKWGIENAKNSGMALALGGITFIILIVLTLFYFRLNKKIESNY